MTLEITKELSAMERMTTDQLRAKYAKVFGEPTRSRHKQHLIKRIAWRLQANAEGGLSERARRRAMELANEADLRVTAPRDYQPVPAVAEQTIVAPTKSKPKNGLLPGTVLQRDYKDQTVFVTVLADGFEYEGDRYRSLTAVAKAVTGTHWNGYHFFGLRKKEGSR